MKQGSQAYQDRFALQVCKNKTYIEIGANCPVRRSNTYFLEEEHNFKGFSIEFDTLWEKRWRKSSRNNKVYWADAITFDYSNAAKENNLTKNIGYLSCDIEPPSNTFLALKKVISEGFVFECITFEHDEYNFPETDFNKQATEYLESHGYKVAVKNVYFNNPNQHFETWYVHNSVEFNETSFDIWKLSL